MNPAQLILQQMLNQPLMIEPIYAQAFLDDRAQYLESMTPEIMEAMQAGLYGSPDREAKHIYYREENGVAILPIKGTLSHQASYLHPMWGVTGYKGIVARAMEAASDPKVKGILLDMDSAGGTVAGCFDTVKILKKIAADSGKPIWSICNDMAYSAAMALISSASHRLTTDNGGSGSVGVLMAHTDRSAMMKEYGMKITLIIAGKHKADGNPYEKLPKEVLADFQAEADTIREEFVAYVADAIGKKPAYVMETEAQTYRGKQAVDIGFADEVVNGYEAVQVFSEFLNKKTKTTVAGVTMSNEKNKPVVKDDKNEIVEPKTPVVSSNKPDAEANERSRIKSIMQSEAGLANTALASHFALNTGMSADESIAALAAAGEATPAAVIDPLEKAMGKSKTPKVKADGEQELEAKAGGDESAEFLASHAKATGQPVKA